jgi:hypothetical protein
MPKTNPPAAPTQREIIDRALGETGWSLERLAEFWEIDPKTLNKYRSDQQAGKALLRCIALTPLMLEAEAIAKEAAENRSPTLRGKFEDLLARGNAEESGIVHEVVGSLWSLMLRRIAQEGAQNP